jgi:hypothetical protein
MTTKFEHLRGQVPDELLEALDRETLHPDPLESNEEYRLRIVQEAEALTTAARADLDESISEVSRFAEEAVSAESVVLNAKIDSGIIEAKAETNGLIDSARSDLGDEIGAVRDFVTEAVNTESTLINALISAHVSEARDETNGQIDTVRADLSDTYDKLSNLITESVYAESSVINNRIGTKKSVTTTDAIATTIDTITLPVRASTKIIAEFTAHRTDVRRYEAAIYQLVCLARATPGFGTLTLNSNPGAGETVTIGGTVYTFQVAPGAPFDVTIGVNSQASVDNLVAAITLTGTPGVDYDAGTTKHPSVTACRSSAAGPPSTMDVAAMVPGLAGNAIVTTETLVDVLSIWTGGTLAGGTDMSIFGVTKNNVYEDDATWDVGAVASGANVDLTVTGANLKQIEWSVDYRLIDLFTE